MHHNHRLLIPDSQSGTSVAWEEYGKNFQQGSGPWGIAITRLTETDWRRFLDYLRQTEAVMEYSADGEKQQFPDSIELTESGRGHTRLLSLQLGGLRLECPCCNSATIRLRFDPVQIDTEDRARILFRLMSTVGRLLDRTVVLGPEAGTPVFEYRPGSGLRYHGLPAA
jgi:hypothetical protein